MIIGICTLIISFYGIGFIIRTLLAVAVICLSVSVKRLIQYKYLQG